MKEMKKFEIRGATAQIERKNRHIIKQGVTMNSDIFHDLDDHTIEAFDTLEEARKVFFEKYSKSYVSNDNGGVIFVKEYWIEEVNYDEDGDIFFDPWGNDPVEWSKMPAPDFD